MTDPVESLQRRVRTELDAAGVLAREGFSDQATSRAYYAAFFAAEAALLSLGETRSKHSGVIAAFGRLVVKDGGLDPEVAGVLRQLFELRNAADYSWLDAQRDDEVDAVALATRFADAVAEWLASGPT